MGQGLHLKNKWEGRFQTGVGVGGIEVGRSGTAGTGVVSEEEVGEMTMFQNGVGVSGTEVVRRRTTGTCLLPQS